MSERSRVAVNRQAVDAQAGRIRAALELTRPGMAAQLAHDTVEQLDAWQDIALRSVPAAQTDAGCSVAGAYFASLVPPVLAIAEATSPGRRAFTALHELGHHLQQTELTLMDALLDQPDGGHSLEDASCDAFAAEILLPSELVGSHLAGGVTAPGVAALWDASSASRAAACVRAAQQLHAPGHVVLLDGAGVVQFAAAHGLPPVRRGSSQADIPVVIEGLRIQTRRAHGRTQLTYRDGIKGVEHYAETADIGGFLVLVMVTDHAPWESTFSLPSRDEGPQGRWWTCEQCGHEFSTYARPCSRCGAPTCPECRRCNCSRVKERQCTRCNTVYPLLMFQGDSERCVDCA